MLPRMTAFLKIAFCLFLGQLFICSNAQACTLAFWNNNDQTKSIARSMDLYVDDNPHLVVYPKNLARSGGTGKNSITWQSKYGSVVITEFDTNAVADGMNEEGLSAQLLYLDGTQYPKPAPEKPGLSNLMWAQYIIDNFKTVQEALDDIKKMEIVSTKVAGREWPVHLTIQDAKGDSAIIEFIKGKMVVHHGAQYRVITNEPAYDIQLANLKKYKLFGGKLPMPGDADPLSRFVRASSYLKTLPVPSNYMQAIAGTLSVIRTVMVPFGAEDTSGNKTTDAWPTRWITLSDLTNKLFYFSSTTAPNIIWIDFSKLNLKSGAPILGLDIKEQSLSGDVSRNLKPYIPPAI